MITYPTNSGLKRKRLLTTTMIAGLAMMAVPATVAITALAPTDASAQDYSSGTLVGNVVDTTGAPVAGATVTVRSVSQGFVRDQTTDANGTFRAPLIPIGSYAVSISKDGYNPTTDSTVRVTLGASSSYSFTLSQPGDVDAVVVTATANPQVDFAQTTIGSVIDVETLVKQVPIARNVTALTLLAPSAVPGDPAFSGQGQGQASIGGSSVGENVFYVNGLNITNFINGIGGAVVPFDFYKSVEVKTGGYSAEFGRATGGVINAVSKSGTNDFMFALHGNYAPNSLRETSPDSFQRDNHLAENEQSDITFEVGGPIIKDHLFFYGLGNFPKSEVTRALKTNSFYGISKSSDPFYAAKIDAYLTSRQHFELTYFNTNQETKEDRYAYTLPAGGTTYVRGNLNTTQTTKDGGESYVGRYTGSFTDWLTVSAAYGKTYFDATSVNNLFGEPVVSDVRTGTARTISRQTTAASAFPSRATREFKRADVDIYASLFGDHHFRIGYDEEDTTYLNISRRNGGQNWQIQKNRGTTVNAQGFAPGQEYFILRTFTGGGEFLGTNKAIYAQDAWDITENLSINIGWRQDKFLEQDAAGQAFSNFDDEQALRLGFTWDPFGEKQDKVWGFYGRYYLPVAANTAFRAASNNLDVSQYFLPAGNGLTVGTLDPVTGLPTAGLGSIATSTTNPTFTALRACTTAYLARGIRPVAAGTIACTVGSDGTPPPPEAISATNVQSTMEDEFILGYEHRFNSLWKGSAVLTYRSLLRAADDLLLDPAVLAYCRSKGLAMTNAAHTGCEDNYVGAFYLISNPGSDVQAVLPDALPDGTTMLTLKASDLGFPAPKREYTALELSFERAFDGKWGLQGSYVLSESKGNFEGAVKSDTGQADAGITSDFDLPSFAIGAYGLLPNHHAHQFKAFGSYMVTDNLMVGANYSLISPRKYGCRGNVPARYSDASDAAGYQQTDPPGWFCQGQLTPRGSKLESDWINRFDMSFRYTVPTQFTAGGDLVLRADIFNVFNLDSITEIYERGDLASGSIDPNYGAPGSTGGGTTGYQAPRSIRFGFDLVF